MAENPYISPSLERGLRLLQLFDRQVTRIAPPEIARRLQIPRSAAFRLVQTLEHLGFLERHGNDFALGPGVLRLGFEYLASLDITELARPLVDRLRDRSGFAAQLGIRDGTEVVVVLRASAPSSFVSTVSVGTRLPAHATILGRVLLGDLTDAALRALYPQSTLPALGANTPPTTAELIRLVREDAARGYAVSESFFEHGVSAVAAPVRDDSGRVRAVLSVTIPMQAMEAKLRENIIRLVIDTAAELSHRLNYRAPVTLSVPQR